MQEPGTTGFTRHDHLDGRVDYNVTNNDAVFARLSWRRMPLDYTDVYPLRVTQLRRSRSGVLSWNRTISPAAVNEFRFGATYHTNPYHILTLGTDLVRQFGIEGVSDIPLYNAPSFSINGVSSPNLQAAGDSYTNNPAVSYEFINNLSWTRGRHLMKFGFDAIRDQLNGGPIDASMYGVFNFTGIYSGLGYADFLLGIPQTSSISVPTPPRDFRGTTWALFAQDQFKVNRSLTLNFGMRWQLNGPYFSKHGAMYSFNPATGALVIPDNGQSKLNPLYPQNIRVIKASEAGYPADSLVAFNMGSLANLQPRVGFAYKLFGGDTTVIRGGYGIYSNLIYGTLAAQGMRGGPFSGSATHTNAIVNGVPLFRFPNAFLPAGTTSTQNVVGVNPDLKTPYTQQWNLTLERQMGSLGIRLSYLGSRMVNLAYRKNLNQPAPGTERFTTSRRAYPIFNQVQFVDSGGYGKYDALEVGVERKVGRNLTFNTGWTWAKNLTDTQESAPYAGQVLQNQFNRAAERANDSSSVPHRLFAYAVYALPFGASQAILPASKGLVQHIIGGWETAWTLVAQSGMYFTPSFSGFDPSNTNTIGGVPDRIKDGNLSSGRTIDRWFDKTAFAIPGCPDSNPVCSNPANVGRFGNSGWNILTGPRVFNLDFSLMKVFPIREGNDLQFRMVMGNAFNHPNFGLPRANINSPSTLGTIASQVRAFGGQPPSREINFGLRLRF